MSLNSDINLKFGSFNGEKVFISTYGCQMNDHDTERMYALLELNQFQQAVSAEEADVIIINSCSVREKPVHKVMSEIGTYQPLKAKKPHLKIGVGGCVGQQEGQKLFQRAKILDFVFGTDTIDQLPQIIKETRAGKKRQAWTRMGHRDPYEIQTLVRETPVSAFVTITKGCDNFCSFCVVPFTRGRERSRLLHEIIQDVKNLVERGVKEVTLLGQNVNSYKSPDGNGVFTDLLRAVCEETNVLRLRYTTSHPKDFNDEVIAIHSKYKEKLGLYLHLPVQSGSSRVLAAMNRGYTREEYLEKVRKLWAQIPEMCLSTDIIVGFPGETREDFEETLSLLKEVKYENVYAFKYSPRPFTQALKLTDQIDEEEKEKRLCEIIDLQDQFGDEIAAKYADQVYPILVEGPSRTNKEVLTGRTPHNKVVNFEGALHLIGQVLPIKITKAFQFSLRGEVVGI